MDDWEAAAVDALGDLAAFALIELSDILESQAELLASAFHMVWTGGEAQYADAGAEAALHHHGRPSGFAVGYA
ncbi:hypothetical protein [Rhizobium sp. AN83]|uniref:hypothetical protein n=1 Tax=Rhizobium sp. AN83 TaxID=3035217 RepID=UPI002B25860E|nr:hypothetical protein [Rhizobium sp. AN83]